MLSDIELARRTKLLPIEDIGAKIGIPADALYRYGPHKAKLSLDYIGKLPAQKSGKLILVTATSPTPAGEGKSTTTIGLGDALTRIGKKTIICLREPSLGPCFGMKGGATGGGHAQVAPMDEINLHFTGDFHAITAANNLLAAMLDNHIYWGNTLDIDLTRITWRRAMDVNDRALRNIKLNLGKGLTREDGFDITVASEVMAIFCLSKSLQDMEERLSRIVVAYTTKGAMITAKDIQAAPAMVALLRDAFQPNLVQTLEHTPAFVHGGPFANIAHGCNSLIATETALRMADYVVTEAGFGADLGAEKFFDIKCRLGGLSPSAVVIVTTARALKMHGGVAKSDLTYENVAAIKSGISNLTRHIDNVKKFGVPVIVAVNHFTSDTQAEINIIIETCHAMGVNAHLCRHWAEGGAGAEELANDVVVLSGGAATHRFTPLYPDAMPLADKIRTIAKEIYHAADVDFSAEALNKLQTYEATGFGVLPVCMAKTQYSFSADPAVLGAPAGHILPVRDVRLSAGAGFVVAICGAIMTMPGLPRDPAAHRIHVDKDGLIQGLF